MVFASAVVAPVSAQSHAERHLRVVDAPKFSALPHAILRDTSLSCEARLLYAVLQSYWWQGGECWAGNAVLAADMGCSDSQLRRYLGELLRANLITSRMRGQGQGKAYAPTKPIQGDGKAYRQPLTSERFNRSDTDGSEGNRSPMTPQPFTSDQFNRSPVTDSYKKTTEDSSKEEDNPIGLVAAEAAAMPSAAPAKGKSEKRATRLQEDAALTDDHIQAASDIGLDRAAAEAEWLQFKDYHRAKGSTMLDWLAAWRTWCRNSLKFAARKNGAYGATTRTNGTAAPKPRTDGAKGWNVKRY